MNPDFVARDLLNAGLALFRERGYQAVEPNQIAERAGCSLEELYRRFPRKESFITGLFLRTSLQLQTAVADAPAGPLVDRFRYLMDQLLAFLQPYRETLRQVLPMMMDPASGLGVLGRATDRIRDEVQGAYRVLLMGSEDRPKHDRAAEIDSLVQFLYFAHLGLIFLFLQDQHDSPDFMGNNLALAGDLILVVQKGLLGSAPRWLVNQFAELAGLPRPEQIRRRVDQLVRDYLHPPHDSARHSQAENLLLDLFRFRRLQPDSGKCGTEPCPQCLALHLPKVEQVLGTDAPLTLVLPAFPAKSPNLSKVTGPLPDLAEELALRFLQQRCAEIARVHAPGARMLICSDGRVFSDVVGVTDADVTAYRTALIEMIARLNLPSLQVFDLDDVRPQLDFDQMRQWLMERYGEPLAELEERTRQHRHHQQLYNGIHRFMFEDLLDRQPQLSRNQARKQSKQTAYEVIRRSNAWSRLVSEIFPDALRLSIHPQLPHADKIGILLGEADDVWLTPWHGVALLRADRFVLTRRRSAEEQGARLVTRDDRPSHFEDP